MNNPFSYPLNRVLCTMSIAIISILANAAENPSWPREIKTEEATIVIYQPQIEEFTEIMLEARAAIAVTLKKTKSPVFGAVWFNSKVLTDIEKREVLLEDLVVKRLKFPEAGEGDRDKLINILESEVPQWEIKLSLDRLLASIDADEQAMKGDAYDNKAPDIIFSEEPAILLIIDGDPVYREIKGFEKYKYVLNTPFFICTADEKDFFLYGNRIWYKSGDLYGGWKQTAFPPQELKQMMEEEEKQKQKEMGNDYDSGKPMAAKIYVRTHPAELLQSVGTPKYDALEGTDLLYMSNTENDIIMDINSQTYYILISGRWYSSSSLTSNDWTFVDSKELPEYFSSIPANSDIANVRLSVAGTEEAMDATLENSIPQTAEIDRNTASVEVSYDGEPGFEDIKGTEIKYAVNTDKSVLVIDNRYYCCDEGVWFKAYSAKGPWTVCVDVPGEFRNIPPEYPVYNVKYVQVYSYTPQYVYVGYTPGYLGSYYYNGVVVYGTGYHYSSWYGRYYYPRHVSYGYGVHYSPYTGWGFSYGISHGWFHTSYRSGPYYYSSYWGPAGYHSGYRYGYGRGYHYSYRPAYTTGARPYYNGSRSSSTVASHSRSTYRSSNVYRNRDSGVSRAGTRPSSTAGTTVSKDNRVRRSGREVPRSNDVYTDSDGNIHRRTAQGWEKREGGEWTGENRALRNSGGRASAGNRSSDPGKDRGNSQNSNRYSKERTKPENRSGNTGNYNRSGSSPNKTGNSGKASSNTRTTNNSLDRSYQSRSKGTQKTRQYKQSGSSKRSSSSRSSGSRSKQSTATGRRR